MSQSAIKQTCYEMLSQRGYKNVKINDNATITATKLNGAKICLFLTIINKCGVDKYQEYMTLAEEKKIKHIIIIANKVTTHIQNLIKNTINMDVRIEVFNQDELKFNITKHRLVPKHELLSPEETKEMKEKWQGDKFPVILRNDAISRFYNYSPGNIIKITRHNGDISYRIVK